MLLRGRGPWVVSTGLHVALLAWGVFLLLQVPDEGPPVLRMRLTAPTGGQASNPTPGSWMPPKAPAPSWPFEPTLPAWQTSNPTVPPRPSVTAPVSLEELLIAPSVPEPSNAPSTESGWSGPPGLGYAPPPLPPPTLVPPQGAQWSLVLAVPAGGGLAQAIEGLDSGHPELDLWLETYLRTVSLPSSPDGRGYQLRWTLKLASGRPE